MASIKVQVENAILAGVPAELRLSGITIDQISTTMVNGEVTDTPVAQLATAWAIRTTYDRKDIDGTQVRQGDIKLLFQVPEGGTAPDPTNDYKVTLDDGLTYRVEDFSIVQPGGTPILYIAQLRR